MFFFSFRRIVVSDGADWTSAVNFTVKDLLPSIDVESQYFEIRYQSAATLKAVKMDVFV